MPRKKVLEGVNDLFSTHPDLAKELINPEDAKSLTYGSKKKVEWMCNFGHTWEAIVKSRASRGSGCPYCVGSKVWAGFNDLATTNPSLCEELLDKEIAKQVSFGSAKKVHWKCSGGHVWMARVADRVEGHGCRTCSMPAGASSYRSLSSARDNPLAAIPGMVESWHTENQSIDLYSAGSGARAKWICREGHLVERRIQHYVKTGCPDCSTWGTSNAEKAFADKIEAAGYEIIRNDRKVIAPMELDIFIPGLMVGIEFNGEYWHQDASREARKASACKGKGVQLLVVWYNDWVANPDGVIASVKTKLSEIEIGHFEKPRL